MTKLRFKSLISIAFFAARILIFDASVSAAHGKEHAVLDIVSKCTPISLAISKSR
jgi:hypothetical protein